MTVEDLIRTLFASQRRDSKGLNIRSTKGHIDARIVPELGDIRLDKLTPIMIDRWIVDLQTIGGRSGHDMTGTAAQRIWDVLMKALNYAVRMDLIAVNPMTKVAKPRREKHKVEPPTPEQVQELFDAATDWPEMVLQLRLACLGLRRGETTALQWRDFDEPGARIFVRHGLSHGEHGIVVDGPTKKENERTVPLDDTTLKLVVEQRRTGRETGLRVGHPINVQGYILSPYHDGTPLTPNAYSLRFARLRKMVGPDCTMPPHQLRHFAASEMLAAGVPPIVVAEILGVSVPVLLSTYGHFVRGADDAIEKLAKRMPR